MNIYDFKVKDGLGNDVSLKEYENKILLIVNTASKCGFTPQFKELQEIYDKYGRDQMEILAFPCNQFAGQEPGSNSEISNFCEINYGVTFSLFDKVDVNGEKASPLFEYLKSEKPGLLGKAIKWNFTKFLIDTNGNVVKRYSPKTNPLSIIPDIDELLK